MVEDIIILVWLHFLADFVLQSDKIATQKSSSLSALGIHSALYGMIFIVAGFQYALLNGVLHGIVDFFSSRIAKKFYQEGDRHSFFVTIGADQAIHMTCLILTYFWMVK
jgi:hypothetical protein